MRPPKAIYCKTPKRGDDLDRLQLVREGQRLICTTCTQISFLSRLPCLTGKSRGNKHQLRIQHKQRLRIWNQEKNYLIAITESTFFGDQTPNNFSVFLGNNTTSTWKNDKEWNSVAGGASLGGEQHDFAGNSFKHNMIISFATTSTTLILLLQHSIIFVRG